MTKCAQCHDLLILTLILTATILLAKVGGPADVKSLAVVVWAAGQLSRKRRRR
jgi:hypothetical protein